MKNFYLIISFISLILIFPDLRSQDESGHERHEHKNEIGGALGMFFDLKEQHTASGFHLHYYRMFSGKLDHFGIAPSMEFLFGEHRHYTLALMLAYRPVHGWWIGAGPGISYVEHHDEVVASGHIETGYEFDAGQVHFGPVLEYSFTREDQHLMLGLHLGVPF